MATENLMMEAVKRGGDRQELHERIRVHAMEAGRQVKEWGRDNDLLKRFAADKAFGLSMEEIKAQLNPSDYIGRCPQQVDEFLQGTIQPILDKNEKGLYETNPDIRV